MSEIRATTISDAAGTGPITLTKQSDAKAWVNFDGSGTIATRESLNVSSLTDSATGKYFTNFTNAMSSADYGGSASGRTNGDVGFDSEGLNTASRLSVASYNSSGTLVDASTLAGIILGDLA